MKKKILFAMATAVLLSSTAAVGGEKTSAGTPVVTKDEPEKCGGYHDGQYHLKCKNEKTAEEGYVEREHKWKNPFSGFTKAEGHTKVKKQGSMPHSR